MLKLNNKKQCFSYLCHINCNCCGSIFDNSSCDIFSPGLTCIVKRNYNFVKWNEYLWKKKKKKRKNIFFYTFSNKTVSAQCKTNGCNSGSIIGSTASGFSGSKAMNCNSS